MNTSSVKVCIIVWWPWGYDVYGDLFFKVWWGWNQYPTIMLGGQVATRLSKV
jgi:hypothetical protein